jgi:hypothetical protein
MQCAEVVFIRGEDPVELALKEFSADGVITVLRDRK